MPCFLRWPVFMALVTASMQVPCQVAAAGAPSVLPVAPATAEDALHGMFAQAGIVFVGEVLEVHRTPGALAVRWQVEEALKGIAPGSEYTQREWPGRWTAGDEPYPVGQRALVLLHTPSPAGYTSPVSGPDGIVPLYGEALSGTVDLRWIAQHAAIQPAGSRQRMNSPVRAEVESGPATGTDEDPEIDYEHADRALVLEMVRAWRGEALRSR